MPAGKADVVSARLTDAPSTDLASLKFYTVKRGDTLLLIARKLHVNKADLAEANYLPVAARVSVGQKLMVPHEATVLMAAETDRGVPATEARSTVAEAGQLAPGATSPTASRPATPSSAATRSRLLRASTRRPSRRSNRGIRGCRAIISPPASV